MSLSQGKELQDRIDRVLPVLREHAAEVDADARFPVESLNALREQGFLGLPAPVAHGGGGASPAVFADVAQQLAGACLSTAQIWAMHFFQVDAIARFGTPELCADLLPRVARGEVYIASVTSERGRGASLFEADAPLRPDGDRVVIERTAPVVTGGAHADGYLVTMRRGPDSSRHDVAWVYADRASLKRTDVVGEWNTLGMRATESIGMVLEGAAPAHNVLRDGELGGVARESMIPMSHLGWAACWLGAARGALADLVRWLRKSGKFDDGGPSDLVLERLGRIRLDLELTSAYLTRVRERVESARADGRSLSDPCTQLQLNSLKLAASELSFRAVDGMIQLGGLRVGYLKNSPVALERVFRDLRAASLNHANDGLWVGVGGLSLMDRSVALI
ncbi:acyl-CoA dehydrogenase [Amycolatopsis sp. A1MSW2902]